MYIVAVTAKAPQVASAATGNKALSACSNAIIKPLSSGKEGSQRYKIDSENNVADGQLGIREVFYMSADTANGTRLPGRNAWSIKLPRFVP